eukprot:XP_025014172.1 probable esterase D14L isoform X2 [Ricinus communis]
MALVRINLSGSTWYRTFLKIIGLFYLTIWVLVLPIQIILTLKDTQLLKDLFVMFLPFWKNYRSSLASWLDTAFLPWLVLLPRSIAPIFSLNSSCSAPLQGGFNQEDLDQMFEGMCSNYEAWCSGFAPTVVGGDMDSVAVQDFSRTLFNMRPDISLSIAKMMFLFDMRHILPMVTIPCHILQSFNDAAVPVAVSDYLHQNLGGPSIIEVMPTEGHLPQLKSPGIVVPVILKHIHLKLTE